MHAIHDFSGKFRLKCRFVNQEAKGRDRIKDEIRRSERGILEAWTSESFSQLAIVCVVCLFAALVALAGGPSDFNADGRCTLPWC